MNTAGLIVAAWAEELAAITQLDSAENFDSAIDRLVRWHKAYQSARAVGSLRVIEGDMR